MPRPLSGDSRVALGIPPVHRCELFFQLRSADAVFVREVRLGVQGVLLRHDRPQGRMAHDDRLQNLILVKFEVVLFQHREALPLVHDHVALGGLQVSGDGT